MILYLEPAVLLQLPWRQRKIDRGSSARSTVEAAHY